MNVHFSSEKSDWSTPQWFVDALSYNFICDMCATKDNRKCINYYGPDHKVKKRRDALQAQWPVTNKDNNFLWMNPPYGRGIYVWMRKAYVEYINYSRSIVCLVPARTDTKWWHDFVMKATCVYFIKGRIKFDNHSNSAPFPSALVIYNGQEREKQLTTGTMDLKWLKNSRGT